MSQKKAQGAGKVVVDVCGGVCHPLRVVERMRQDFISEPSSRGSINITSSVYRDPVQSARVRAMLESPATSAVAAFAASKI